MTMHKQQQKTNVHLSVLSGSTLIGCKTWGLMVSVHSNISRIHIITINYLTSDKILIPCGYRFSLSNHRLVRTILKWESGYLGNRLGESREVAAVAKQFKSMWLTGWSVLNKTIMN